MNNSNGSLLCALCATLAGVSLVVSTAALLIFVFRADTKRFEARAEVWPYLEITRNFESRGYQILVDNRGVGPARVESVEFYSDHEALDGFDALIERVLGERAFGPELYSSSPLLGRVMSSREQLVLFDVSWEDRSRQLATEWESHLSIVACYCSIFDQCWLAQLGKSPNREVSSCRGRSNHLAF